MDDEQIPLIDLEAEAAFFDELGRMIAWLMATRTICEGCGELWARSARENQNQYFQA